MNLRLAFQAGLLALACASALVSVAGMVLGRDALAKLIYSSIPGSTTLVFFAAAFLVQGASGVTIAQVLLILVLSVISGGLAGNRIAGALASRHDERSSARGSSPP